MSSTLTPEERFEEVLQSLEANGGPRLRWLFHDAAISNHIYRIRTNDEGWEIIEYWVDMFEGFFFVGYLRDNTWAQVSQEMADPPLGLRRFQRWAEQVP